MRPQWMAARYDRGPLALMLTQATLLCTTLAHRTIQRHNRSCNPGPYTVDSGHMMQDI